MCRPRKTSSKVNYFLLFSIHPDNFDKRSLNNFTLSHCSIVLFFLIFSPRFIFTCSDCVLLNNVLLSVKIKMDIRGCFSELLLCAAHWFCVYFHFPVVSTGLLLGLLIFHSVETLMTMQVFHSIKIEQTMYVE